MMGTFSPFGLKWIVRKLPWCVRGEKNKVAAVHVDGVWENIVPSGNKTSTTTDMVETNDHFVSLNAMDVENMSRVADQKSNDGCGGCSDERHDQHCRISAENHVFCAVPASNRALNLDVTSTFPSPIHRAHDGIGQGFFSEGEGEEAPLYGEDFRPFDLTTFTSLDESPFHESSVDSRQSVGSNRSCLRETCKSRFGEDGQSGDVGERWTVASDQFNRSDSLISVSTEGRPTWTGGGSGSDPAKKEDLLGGQDDRKLSSGGYIAARVNVAGGASSSDGRNDCPQLFDDSGGPLLARLQLNAGAKTKAHSTSRTSRARAASDHWNLVDRGLSQKPFRD
eukprot:TRINITY_DN64125_c0_g1_i1.p1 TRINITY_DN64125_c0_g1~~TRINITY_DN64125_c0_g1_i1.p1  ORF type:complete len:356 (+),score=34.18 TRINITY_DN64125_c0_g1_i1:60-1070(+)